MELVKSVLQEAHGYLEDLIKNQNTLEQIEQAGRLLSDCFERQGHVYSCGNGGSMCDAMHFAEELSGRFRDDRKALGAVAIADGAYLTCTGNDYGFEHVFSRYLEGHGRKGDVLLAISTSGKSENVIKAAEKARELGIDVICLTGKPNSKLSPLSTIEICTPAGRYADRVQELHIKVIHIMIQLVETNLFHGGKN